MPVEWNDGMELAIRVRDGHSWRVWMRLVPTRSGQGRFHYDYEARRLVGKTWGKALDLAIDIPASSGTAVGSYDGRSVDITWEVPSNYGVDHVEARLDGEFAGDRVQLVGSFTHRSFFFESGRVVGSIGQDAVDLTIRPGAFLTKSVLVDGIIGAYAVSIAGGHQPSQITGQCGDQRVRFKCSSSDRGTEVTLSGCLSPQVVTLMACCLLYFHM